MMKYIVDIEIKCIFDAVFSWIVTGEYDSCSSGTRSVIVINLALR